MVCAVRVEPNKSGWNVNKWNLNKEVRPWGSWTR
jgi:hypothetical protein